VSDRAAAAEGVVGACAKLFDTRAMSISGHGNFSCRLGEARMLLTGAGMSTVPRSADLALVGFDGVVVEGVVTPSTREIVGMHAAIYRCRTTAAAVVHTHSPHVTAFALAHVPLPCRYEALLRHGQAGHVPVVPWAPRGSAASVEGITHALELAPGTQAVLLGNHGLLAFGPSPAAAAALVVALEEAALAELGAASLGGAKDFPADALEAVASSRAASTARPG